MKSIKYDASTDKAVSAKRRLFKKDPKALLRPIVMITSYKPDKKFKIVRRGNRSMVIDSYLAGEGN